VTVRTAHASPAATGRAIAVFARVTRSLVARAASTAQTGGATGIGAAGLLSIAVGAGAQWGWPVGLMVGGPLAVWFASLLPGKS
jgi:hypothetical protein